MPLKVVSDTDQYIPIRELRLGQVARIVAWSEWERYEGQLVIRHPLSIGGVTFANVWNEVPTSDDVLVEVVPDGTQLVVCDNEG